MRILLVQPDYNPRAVGYRLLAMPEPLALELVAAMVPEQDVHILDLRVDPHFDEAMMSFKPDLVAVTALTTEVYVAQEILQKAKQHRPNVFTAVGGHHATLLPEDFQLPYVDAICLGEGEFVFGRLVETLETKRDLRGVPNLIWRDTDDQFVCNGRDVPKTGGESIPHPRRDLVAKNRDAYSWLYERPDTSIATGRGCPYRCNFCSVWQFYHGTIRQMSVEYVLEEIQAVETGYVTFVDDNFLSNPRRESEIAERIKAEGLQLHFGMECRTDSIVRHPELIEKWANIGLKHVLLGLESASDEMLVSINKHNTVQTNNEAIHILQANGVMIWGAFIIEPNWTVEQFKALQEYVYDKKISHTQFTVLTPLPGTQLYHEKRAELLTNDYTCFDALHAVVPTRLPREQFYQHLASLYLKLNTEPIYEYVRQGRLTMDQVRFGHRILKQLGRWEAYLEGDPVLGRRSGKMGLEPKVISTQGTTRRQPESKTKL